jgi:hypothetical protein
MASASASTSSAITSDHLDENCANNPLKRTNSTTKGILKKGSSKDIGE